MKGMYENIIHIKFIFVVLNVNNFLQYLYAQSLL